MLEQLTWFRQASFRWRDDERTIYIDPWGTPDDAPEADDSKSDVAMVPSGGYYTVGPEEAAGLVRAMQPGVAVPMHYGFVVGDVADADRFREAANPVRVEVLTPTLPFERV